MAHKTNQANWLRMLQAMDLMKLAEDPRFKENRDRMVNLAELVSELTPQFKKRLTSDWLNRFEAHGVPAGPVNDVNQMHADPHTRARDMVVEVPHARLGKVRTLGLPVKLGDTPGAVLHGAPLYGQHSREVLREYGYAEDEIDALVADGVLVTDTPTEEVTPA